MLAKILTICCATSHLNPLWFKMVIYLISPDSVVDKMVFHVESHGSFVRLIIWEQMRSVWLLDQGSWPFCCTAFYLVSSASP